MSCDSWDINAPFDVVPVPAPDDHLNPVGLYLGEDIEKYLTHPYASPLFGDFKGLPPLLIQAGDAEVLRDEITLLAHKATLAGVEVQHELYEDQVRFFFRSIDHFLASAEFHCCITGTCIPSLPFPRRSPSRLHLKPQLRPTRLASPPIPLAAAYRRFRPRGTRTRNR